MDSRRFIENNKKKAKKKKTEKIECYKNSNDIRITMTRFKNIFVDLFFQKFLSAQVVQSCRRVEVGQLNRIFDDIAVAVMAEISA